MHSFHHSRGRILFEALCAWTVAGSCVVAWMQTGATALLAAAGAAFLYGLVHLFDMKGRRPARAEEPQRIDFAPDVADITSARQEDVPLTPVLVEEAAPPAPKAAEDRPAKAPRKPRASRAKQAKVIELAIPEPVEAEEPGHFDESEHFPLSPLFEPVPIARQLRTFGRKAG